jgi:hypothetical protein
MERRDEMTHSRLTNQIKASNQSSSRDGTKIDTFLIHHQAGTNDDAAINMMVSGSRKVSANYTISNEGRITLVVDEDRRAWTSGSPSDGGKGAAWDKRAITVEIENESAAPDWRISIAAKTAAARLLQDLRTRYSIAHVLGHRDLWEKYRASYSTYCPGPETVAQILALANSAPANDEDDDMPDRGEILPFRETNDGRTDTPSIFFRSPVRGIIGIRNPYELGLLSRYVNVTAAKPERMFPAETAMINYYLVMPVAGSTVVDTSFLTKTVQDSIAALGKTLKVDADLTDEDIAAISLAVNTEFAKRVSV